MTQLACLAMVWRSRLLPIMQALQFTNTIFHSFPASVPTPLGIMQRCAGAPFKNAGRDSTCELLKASLIFIGGFPS